MEKHRRQRNKGIRFLLFLPILILAILLVYVWFGRVRHVGNRMTVVLVGDPVVVASWDKKDNSFLFVTIPATAVIDSVHGYGAYSLESLWKLGSIEGRSGKVLSESVEELLAVPVPWYVGKKNHMLLNASDPLTLIKSVFSPPAWLAFFRGAYVTNMSPKEFLTFALAISRRSGDVTSIDLARALTAQTLPDGSEQRTLDLNKVDQAIGEHFEDAAVRKESKTVAVFNTTPIASLGNRVSRLLGHAGMLVVAVGNDRPTIGSCLLRGKKTDLASLTAQFIREQYGCRIEEAEEPRADLILRIGTEYQSRFVPFTK